MAEESPEVIDPERPHQFDSDRVAEFLDVVELMAAGDTKKRLTISPRRDELDAIAHGINVLVSELGWATARAVEAHEERAASAERANASKNIFLRNMSHEIRTPIMAMLGFADLLAADDLTPQDRSDLLHRLQNNGLAVLSLLDDLLDLAKLDAHKIALNPERVSVSNLVADVLASLEIESRAKKLETRMDVVGTALGVILTDRYRLRQILVNLIANAIKFTEAGTVVVSICTVQGLEGEHWTIDVSDTGIGIPADWHPHLFEPFAQASTSIAREYGGNGLGLALSRRLADLLGGELNLLRSAPGEGTTFRLVLRPLQAEPQSVHAALRASYELLKGLKILLAEDHPDLHFALRRLLEREGARVESAHDGREAVTKVLSADFDVVLMDVRMPHMDGLHATRALRSQGALVPIIALTGDPASMNRAEALAAGCNVCLSKPFTLDELSDAIESLRDRRRTDAS